jgi:predicted CoA-binding protein
MSEPETTIRRVLTRARSIALVGASERPERDSHHVMQFLQQRGYRVIPVNPAVAGREILGETVRASLRELGEPVDLVDVFRRSEVAGETVDEAIAIGARAVWLQLGVIDEAAAARARAAGLDVVMDRCPAIEMPRLAIPGPAKRA